MDFESIQKQVDQMMHEQNNRSIPDFEGYSPNEMHYVLYHTFEPKSPIILNKVADSDYNKIPMHNLVKYYLGLIMKAGEIKLTAKGFLPTKIVKDIYGQGFLEEDQFTSGISKLSKESDSLTINLARILAELARLTKRRLGKLSLTKAGEKTFSNNQELFELIFKTMTQKFSWAYYDGFQSEQIGQFGYGFSLILLSKYGAKEQLNSFYSEKYLKAFPNLLESIESGYRTAEEYADHSYSVRTFERFLDYFGFVEIENRGKGFDRQTFITKTELFDKLINLQPHKKNL